jgi:S-formylglutathione hydrolase FrmB
MAQRNVTDVAGVEMIWVVLDPNCRLGHHVFADSANNGPVGQALTQELIPYIEKNFRAVGKPSGRFVTGHSSGGWSSLWLQVTYPDFFNGTWSTAPDPVDFRDFQRIDLYAPGANMFTGPDGKQRPLARSGARVLQYYKPFSDMEEVAGHGGQLGSFEAVFSPKGADGKPRRLWDRKTGAVDPEVAKEWQKYDIRLVLERNWKELGPKLQGKIHVYMGGEDTFYLDGAARLLAASLKQLGSDAVVEVVPGRDHFTLMDQAMRRRIAQEMAERFKATNKAE